ncbi:response regulator [Candidatus Parabeggiatoa sp. HSG14]|uniref:response regulator n=1 Tax=Candidatus Parabeggiatoa sp. HSG14 TaxID=3055593 RepID=UPI0025A91BE4|nr:ATP-binding protein [Thiotrichales bacterium HSG14]
MKIRTKLLVVTLAMSLIPAMIIGVFSLFQNQDTLKNKTFSHLESVREIKKAQLEVLFAEQRGDMDILLDVVANFNQNIFKKSQSVPVNQLEDFFASKLTSKQEDFFANYIRQHNFYDLFFIHPDGQIFYTVKHELDYSTNILTGKYANSELGQLIPKVLKSKTFGMSDFAPYAPSFNKPAAFIAQPLLHNGTIELVVALQLSGTVINRIMQERTGMGNTGETYLVGKDKLMRSNSYLDPIHHSLKASFTNPIKGAVNTEASSNALSGETGKKIIKNYRNVSVLSAYTYINIGDTTWAIIAEIDASEAFQPIKQFRRFLYIITLLMSIIILILLYRFTKHLTIPLLQVNSHLKTLAMGKIVEDDIDYSMKDEIGELVISTCTLKKAIENTIAQANAIATGNYSSDVKLLSQQDQLGQALTEMTHRLRNITAISEAIASGDSSPTKIDVKGKQDRLAMSINIMLETRENVISQANQISKGDYTTNIIPRSDKDILGMALQNMTKTLHDISAENQKQNWLKTGQNQLSETMRGEWDIVLFSRKIITFLVKYLSVQIGVLYLYNEETEVLELTANYAFNKRKSLSETFKIGEGLVGQAALDREIISTTNIPEDYMRINSAIGDAIPRYLIIVPFIYEETLKGVIELGSFQEFSSTALEFMTIIMENIAIGINSTQSRSRMKKLLKQTQIQAEELISQQEELKQSNEELEEQAIVLRENEEKLQIQKEDLQDINLELNRTRCEIEKKAIELKKSSKYKSEFLATMSHELRTPLNSMLILSQQLAQNEEGNLTKHQVEAAQIVYNSGSDLLALINEILDLSKIEAGKMSIVVEKVWLSDIANIIIANFNPIADKKGLVLHVNIDKTLPEFIITDHQRLNQILKNLISNAIKFTTKGSINVDFHKPDTKIYLSRSDFALNKALAISVIDTGIGIPKDKQQEIFEAFQQIDGGISRKYGGTGLGLSISKELTKLLDGEIQLTSVEGEGSTFTIYIPENIEKGKKENQIKEEQVKEDNLFTQEQEPLLCSSKKKPFSLSSQENDIPLLDMSDDRDNIEKKDRVILLIEDELEFAKILYQFCHKKGFKCLHAQESKIGLKLAKQYLPYAILLDSKLFKIDDRLTIDAFKENLKISHIPIHTISVEMPYLDEIALFLNSIVENIPATQKPKIISKPYDKKTLFKDKKILLVDDDMRNVYALSHILQKNEMEIYKAVNGKDALDILEKTPTIDLVIIDVMMPVMNGYETMQAIRTQKQFEHLPIIVLTAKAMKEDREKSITAGANDYLTKPVQIEQLFSLMRIWLYK